MTAVVLPDGSVPHVLPPFTRDGLVAEVHGYTGETPFVRWGNWLPVSLAMLLLAVAAMTRKTK